MIVAGYKVINEADFMHQSIASIYRWVDKIIIFESCYEKMKLVALPSRLTKEGLSTDGTTRIIKNFPDPEHKIEYHPVGFVDDSEWDLRTRLVQMVDVGDILWLMDGDEVYSDKLSEAIHEWIKVRGVDCFWLPGMIFWHDLRHFRDGFGWDRAHQRIYRKLSDSSYYDPRDLLVRCHDEEGQKLGHRCVRADGTRHVYMKPPVGTTIFGKERQCLLGTMDNLWYFHYAYVRSPQRILEKMLMQFIQNIATDPEQNMDEWNHFQNYDSVLEFKLATHPWFTNHDFPEQIRVTNVKHPRYMNGHRSFKFNWKEQPTPMDMKTAKTLVQECRREELEV